MQRSPKALQARSLPSIAGCVFAVLACSGGSRNAEPLRSTAEGASSGAAGTFTTSAVETSVAGAPRGPRVAGGSAGGTTSDLASPGVAGVAGNTNVAGSSGCPEPMDLGVSFVGRFDGCVADAVRFAWSGTGFVARFNGTGISARLRGNANLFTLVLDGTQLPTLVTTDGERDVVLATGLPAGAHVVELYRRTEPSVGVTSLVSVSVESGELDTPLAAAARQIELVGDSISCGYGNEGTSPCAFSPETENHYLSYGALLARTMGAELSTVAWSGKGVARNYGGNQVFPMPVLYDRAVPGESRSLWEFKHQPHLVLINLGTNDFSGGTDPSESEFVSAYQGLLTKIRSHYPDAYILCTVGPMLSGTDLTAKARPYIAKAVSALRATGDLNLEAYEMTTPNPNPGCDSHPSLLTHAAMADELAARIKPILGW